MATETPPLTGGVAAPRPLAKKRFRPADALFFGGVLGGRPDLARAARVAADRDPDRGAAAPGLGLPDRADLDQPGPGGLQLLDPRHLRADGDHVRDRDPASASRRRSTSRSSPPSAASSCCRRPTPATGGCATCAPGAPRARGSDGRASPRAPARVVGAHRPAHQPDHRRQHLQPGGRALDHLRPAGPGRLRRDRRAAEEHAGRGADARAARAADHHHREPRGHQGGPRVDRAGGDGARRDPVAGRLAPGLPGRAAGDAHRHDPRPLARHRRGRAR